MSMLSKEAFLKLEESLKNKGGFSVDFFTPEGFKAFESSSGYLVSVKKYEEILTLKDFTYERVKAYLIKEDLKYSIEPLIFGAWKDEEGKIYLDINSHELTYKHAVRRAIEENQKAFFDLKNKKSIYLNTIGAWEFLTHE